MTPSFEADLPRYSIGYLSPLDVTDYDASEFYKVVPSEVLLVILPLGIEEFSASDVERILEPLDQKGAKVVYNDPFIPAFPAMRHYRHLRVRPVALTEKELASKDAVLIATDHGDYDWPWIVKHSSLVVDTRNACREVAERSKIVRA